MSESATAVSSNLRASRRHRPPPRRAVRLDASPRLRRARPHSPSRRGAKQRGCCRRSRRPRRGLRRRGRIGAANLWRTAATRVRSASGGPGAQIAARADMHRRISSRPSARPACGTPHWEKRAPAFCATERTTSGRRLDQHVGDASLRLWRCEIASRCCWLWVAARLGRSCRRAAANSEARLRHADVVVGARLRMTPVARSQCAQAARKLSARILLDRRREPLHHVVEQRDVVVAETVRAADEQIGDAPKRGARFSPTWRRSASSISSIRFGDAS